MDGITRDERRVEASGCNDDVTLVVLPVVAYTACFGDLFDTRVYRLDVVFLDCLHFQSDLCDISMGANLRRETDPPKAKFVCIRLESQEQASFELLHQ